MTHATGVFVDKCPQCGNAQEALIGYRSHCKGCGHDWTSIRNMLTQPVTRFHNWMDDEGGYNEFIPESFSAGDCDVCEWRIMPHEGHCHMFEKRMRDCAKWKPMATERKL